MLAGHRAGGEHVGLAAGDGGRHLDDDVALAGDAAAVARWDDAVDENDAVVPRRRAERAGKRHRRPAAIDTGRAAQAAGGDLEAVGQDVGEGDVGDVAVDEVVGEANQEGVGVTDVAGALVARRTALADPEVGERRRGQQARGEERTSESNPQQAGRHSWTKHHSGTLLLVFRPENDAHCSTANHDSRVSPVNEADPDNSADAEQLHGF
ncbi:hypothetical protein [Pseudomonas sp.]|uniref:hypothetical protein n=1 Tax=Pseudomonas sp. TaxID=306 RepID=UPI0028B00B44|nr:hypothetical protein [Pseudomonas sp.]